MARPFSSAHDPYAAREQRTQQLLREAAAARSAARRDRLRQEAAFLNVDMALGVARPYHGRGIEDEDIDQVAFLGLWKAVLRFTSDPEPSSAEGPHEATAGSDNSQVDSDEPRPEGEGDGNSSRRFAAYAIPTITGEVKRHFRDHGWMVRPPRRVQEQTLAVHHAVTALRQELGHEPADSDLTSRLGITTRELDQARQARHGYYAQSLDTPLHADGPATLTDTLPDELDAFTLLETSLTLRWAIDQLSDGERQLLTMRYSQGLTQSDIGVALGVSQMLVSRLLSRVHARLRDYLTLEAS